jgi:hypothetical protein
VCPEQLGAFQSQQSFRVTALFAKEMAWTRHLLFFGTYTNELEGFRKYDHISAYKKPQKVLLGFIKSSYEHLHSQSFDMFW